MDPPPPPTRHLGPLVIPAEAGIQGILGDNPHSGNNPPELKKLHKLQQLSDADS